jgi:hypothetical protein
LPIEYLEGPYRYHGTMRGEPVTGVALYEATIAMYRDWELIDVLATQVAAAHADSDELGSALDGARSHIARRNDAVTLDFLRDELRPLVAVLPGDELLELLGDLTDAVRNGVR